MKTDSINRLTSLIFTMRHLVLEHVKAQKEINPTTFLRLEVLRYVSERDHPSMQNLAIHFGVTPPSATALVEALVKSDNLGRITDNHDRRLVRLKISAKGEKTLKAGQQDMTTRMKRLLAGLDESDRINLIKIFTKLSKVYRH